MTKRGPSSRPCRTRSAAAIVLHASASINPGAYVAALADSVTARGGKIVTAARSRASRTPRPASSSPTTSVRPSTYDADVVATAAWLGKLRASFGVKRVVQAGRGYSFSVAVNDLPNGPVYFPRARVACTPVGTGSGRRHDGFRQPEAALDRRRIKAIVESARPLLQGADPRPPPGRVGRLPPVHHRRTAAHRRLAQPQVFVAGGHGMWGITLGPVTGRLLAEQIVTGHAPGAARAVRPAALSHRRAWHRPLGEVPARCSPQPASARPACRRRPRRCRSPAARRWAPPPPRRHASRGRRRGRCRSTRPSLKRTVHDPRTAYPS